MRRSPILFLFAVILALPAPARAALREDAVPGTDPRTPSFVADDAGRPVDTDGAIPCVIVTDHALAPFFVRLAQAHAHAGLAARIRTVQSIHQAYPAGRDDAERIRMFLKDAHAHWGTRWVLLGGDEPLVPARRALLRTGSSLGDIRLPTDQYYACLDGTWNADGDDDWGESPKPALGEPGDDVDFVPELNVGRAPVVTRQEARRFVDKTVRAMDAGVEGNPLRVVLAAAHLGFGVDLARYAEQVAARLPGAPAPRITRLYQNWEAWPGSAPLSRAALLDALEGGCDLAVLAGRGAPEDIGAGTSGVFEAGDAPSERVTDEDLLTLTAPFPCHAYVLSAWTTTPGTRSIGAALLRAPGGAVTVVGCTDLQLVGDAGRLMETFFEHAVGDDAPTIGDALRQAIAELATDLPLNDALRLTVQGNLLLGDPALAFPAAGAGPHDRRPGARAAATAVPETVVSLAPGMVHPNPATETAQIEFTVPGTAEGRPLAITVVDVTGRRVRSLSRRVARAGPVSATWDLRNDDRVRVDPGLYFARIALGDEVRVCRIAVTR